MVSVIIPVLNEEKLIEGLLSFFCACNLQESFEIIVVDGGSTDKTISICQSFSVRLLSTRTASRAHQMNTGAKSANGDILYFVHADSLPPITFLRDINKAVLDGFEAGCYRFKFRDKNNPLLYINDFFTRLPFQWCRGGDQTLFITQRLFNQLGGYDEDFVIMEDFELLDRIMAVVKFKIMPKSVYLSSRKYKMNAYLKVQLANMKAMRMFRNGVNPREIRSFYKKALVS